MGRAARLIFDTLRRCRHLDKEVCTTCRNTPPGIPTTLQLPEKNARLAAGPWPDVRGGQLPILRADLHRRPVWHGAHGSTPHRAPFASDMPVIQWRRTHRQPMRPTEPGWELSYSPRLNTRGRGKAPTVGGWSAVPVARADIITVRLGDRSGGSPGMAPQTFFLRTASSFVSLRCLRHMHLGAAA